MKIKRSLLMAALHVLVLAGFSLLQGCATGECPVCWLNWPYNVPPEEPLIIPADSAEPDYIEESLFLPPAAPADMPDITYTEPVITEPAVADHIYTVRKGDTLSGIASAYGTSWKNLSEHNGLSDPHKLYVGQEIRIPGTLSASAPVVRSSSSPGSSASSGSSGRGAIAQGSSYVIQKGDTLSGIAKRAGLSVAEIKAANALDSSIIVAGKSLSIPKKGEVNSSSYSVPETVSMPAPEPEPFAGSAPEPAPLADLAPVESSASAPVYDHVLYPGETLEDVARQYGTSQEEIMELNGITDPGNVKPGTKLLVPIPE
jgi:LysM repeat protein